MKCVCLQREDPKAVANAVALSQSMTSSKLQCSSRICTCIEWCGATVARTDLSSWLTLAHLHWVAGDHEAAIELADKIVAEIASDVDMLAAQDKQRGPSSVSPPSASAGATRRPRPARKSIYSPVRQSEEPEEERLGGSHPPSPSSSAKSNVGGRSFLADKQFLTSILVGTSRLYRHCGRFSKARQCLENAWRYLFLVDAELMEELRAATGGSASRERAIAALARAPTLLGWRLPEACGEDRHTIVPLLLGPKRMNESIHAHKGWWTPHSHECEADILAECASLIAAEEENKRNVVQSAPYQSQVKELYSLALGVYPQHVRSLLALCHFEYSRHKALVATHGDVRDKKQLLGAYHFVKQALSLRDLNADAWQLYGQVVLAMMDEDVREESLSALMTSLECQEHLPLRPFYSVFM